MWRHGWSFINWCTKVWSLGTKCWMIEKLFLQIILQSALSWNKILHSNRTICGEVLTQLSHPAFKLGSRSLGDNQWFTSFSQRSSLPAVSLWRLTPTIFYTEKLPSEEDSSASQRTGRARASLNENLMASRASLLPLIKPPPAPATDCKAGEVGYI